MLLDKDARGESFRRVGVENGHRGLQHDGSRVEVAVDEMNGGAAHLHAVLPRLVLRLEPGEGGQQRRVDVQDGVGKGGDEHRAEKAHEAGQAHEADITGPKFLDEPAIVVLTTREIAMAQAQRLDARVSRPIESGRIRPVGDDDGNARSQAPVGDGPDDRLQGAAAARDQNAEGAILNSQFSILNSGT